MFHAAFRRLLALDDPPERTAFAFSAGVFIAFSPFLGLRTVMATALALAFRFNKIAIYSGTFINNPLLTLVPIVVASYAVGAFLLGRPLILPAAGMQLLRAPHLFSGPYWHALLAHGWNLLLPFAIGGMILSVVGSLAAYPLMLRALRARRRRKGAAEPAES